MNQLVEYEFRLCDQKSKASMKIAIGSLIDIAVACSQTKYKQVHMKLDRRSRFHLELKLPLNRRQALLTCQRG